MIDYKQIWDAIPFPAFVLGREDVVLSANGAAEQLSGASFQSLAKKGLAEFLGKNSIVLSTINQARSENASMAQYGVAVTNQRQTSIACNVNVSFLDNDHENILLVIQPTGVAHKMSQSLTHLNAARSVAALAGMLSHEIRNPLAGISGAAQLLAMNLSDEDREFTTMIADEAKRIGNLVDRVEHFGDQRPVERAPVNIHDVLDRAVRTARAGYAGNTEIRVDYDPSLPEVAGDNDQLLQVFQNLLKNASEACMDRRGASITLRTSYHSGMKFSVTGAKRENLPLQIEIIDTGRGIPSNLIDDIFDPFVTSKSNGTGLGLSLVSKIVANHGGLIECESDENKTNFCIRLPIWHEQKRES